MIQISRLLAIRFQNIINPHANTLSMVLQWI